MSRPRPTFKGKPMFPSEWLTADDLAGRDFALEIESIKSETVDTSEGKLRKWILRFKGAKKGLILNSTNASLIEAALGEAESECWIGKRITLYPTTCLAFGEQTACIRVRPAAPKPVKKDTPDAASVAPAAGANASDVQESWR